MGGKLSEIYKYNISGESSYDYRDYDLKSKFKYDEDALYSPSMNVSYFDEEFTNVEKIDVKTLKNIMKGNFKRFTIYDGDKGKAFFTNDFRTGYFDNKILCIEEYIDFFGGGAHGDTYYHYTIISLENGNKLNNDFYKDLIDYNEEFKEFLKKEFIKYHKISEDDFGDDYSPIPEPSYDFDNYYFPIIFIFNNDGTIDIYNAYFPAVRMGYHLLTIEIKKLKPYIKKDSFYKYLFD